MPLDLHSFVPEGDLHPGDELYVVLVESARKVDGGGVAAVRSKNAPSLVLDAAKAASLNWPLGRHLEGKNFGWGRFDLESALITTDLSQVYQRFTTFSPENLRQWWMAVLGPPSGEGVPARVYEDLTTPEGTNASIRALWPVPPELQPSLERLSELHGIPATVSPIRRLLRRVRAKRPFVAVYDVGQGNCNAVCDEAGVPQLYFDFGRPLPFNAHTAPVPFPRFCFSAPPLIVLSHWDFDHWGAVRLPRKMWHQWAINSPWIAPRQYLGPIHLELANKLFGNKMLLLWPDALDLMKSALGDLVRCTGPNALTPGDRNDTGLAFYASDKSQRRRPRDSVLLPGDADFAFIPARNSRHALTGLVASHHGGHVCRVPPPKGYCAHLAVSVGWDNTYGHPRRNAMAAYANAGWHAQMFTWDREECGETRLGSIGLRIRESQAPLRMNPPCGGTSCSLCIVKDEPDERSTEAAQIQDSEPPNVDFSMKTTRPLKAMRPVRFRPKDKVV